MFALAEFARVCLQPLGCDVYARYRTPGAYSWSGKLRHSSSRRPARVHRLTPLD